MKHKAIFNLYPNAKNINEENGVIEVLDDNGNEVEITDWNAVETKANELQAEIDAKTQSRKDLKASAKAKLIAGEPLTEAEADTLVI